MPTLTREQAQKVARRIAGAPALLPHSPEGRTELVDAILRHCSDYSHAQKVMTELLDSALKPVNMIAALAAIAARTRRPDQAPPGCDKCSLGPNRTTGELEYLSHVSVTIRGYSTAKRCDCARGQWLAEGDRARALQEAETTGAGGFVAAGQVIDSKIVGASELR
jgi:hypothetical protein